MRPIPRTTPRRPSGFTLIELSIVILIIGILLAVVLVASASGLESARLKATQALITKLNVGLEERLEALLAQGVNVNNAHRFLAAATTPTFGAPAPYGTGVNANLPWGLQSEARAEVIARLDQIKAEFPDVFFIDPDVANGGAKGRYPIRFAGLPYPDPAEATLARNQYILPLGNTVGEGVGPGSTQTYFPDPSYQPGPSASYGNVGPGAHIPNFTNAVGTGIHGASYDAARALYKLAGYTARGCDGIDNNRNGSVDEYDEGMQDVNGSGNIPENVAKFDTFLRNHTHKTARAEMLYAILVEGQGPLGSAFSRDDFREHEVKDTDNDGVPEFVDGWGEPLQFFRWPSGHFTAGLQKGSTAYTTFEAREKMPLDPSGQLTALNWWCNNASPAVPSSKCLAVQSYFSPLFDPNWVSGTSPQPTAWDRSGQSPRRAYFTKFLIVSGGPDREPGIPRIQDRAIRGRNVSSLQITQSILGQVGTGASGINYTPGESWAVPLAFNEADPSLALAALPAWAKLQPVEIDLSLDHAADDVSNQAIQSQSGGMQ